MFLESLELRRVLAPLVSVLDPPANSHTAPLSTSIEATFTEILNPTSVNDQTLVVHGAQSGRLLTAGNDSFSAVGTTATVIPSDDFHPGEIVTASATSGIRNGSGEAATRHVWQFRASVLTGSGIFDDSGQSLGSSFGQAVSLGDVDGDGDLDAFVVNAFVGDRANRVWINQGGSQSGTAGTFSDSGQALGNSDSSGVHLGDLDGDGDLDAFVANGSNQPNRVWLNQGGTQAGTPGAFSDSGQSLGSNNSQDLSMGDVDGDGDLDAIVANIHPAGDTQPNIVWINQGGLQSGTAGAFSDSGLPLGTSAAADISLGDVDGDGDLDAFVANIFGQGDQVWLNQGGVQGGVAGSFSNSGQNLGTFTSEGVSLGDLDGDGDLDAFTTSDLDFDRSNRVWINQGGSQGGTAGTFLDSNQTLGDSRSLDVDLGDLDGDGDLDAFVANTNSEENRVWMNQGGLQGGSAGTFATSGTGLGTGQSLGVRLGDLDGDGDLDAFIANFSGQANRVWFNRNLDFGDAPDTFGTTSVQNGARHIPLGPTLGSERDIEDDGQPSVDATGDDVNNTGSADDEDGVAFAANSVGQLDASATVNVAGGAGRLEAWVDFNNDGTFDEVGERIANDLAVAVGDNSVSFDVPADAVSGRALPARFRLSSAGGLGSRGTAADGEVEDHTLTLGAPGGSGSFDDSGQSLGTTPSEDVSLGDVDGDGDLDAFVARSGRQGNLVWINQGGSQSGAVGTFSDSNQSLATGDRDDSAAVSLGDLDGDGDLDAFVANFNAGNRIWINQGGSQGGTPGTFSDGNQSLGASLSLSVSLGDVDGDGDLDAFVANRNQANRVWLNQGGLQGGVPGLFGDSNQALGTSESLDVSLGDVDGDGDLDAFVANRDQPNRVWLNQGGIQGGTAGTFSDSSQSLGALNSSGARLGDLDGDGDLDAFVTNRTQGNRVWINQGAAQSGTAGTFSDSGQSLGAAESCGASLGDLDGDGDLDAFVANDAQGNQVWINQGGLQGGTAGTFSDSGQSLGSLASLEVGLGDLDNDNDLDVFVVNFSDQGNRVWINQPAQAPQATGQSINGPGNNNRSAVVNLTIQFDLPVTVNNVASLKLFNHTTGTPFEIPTATLQGNGTTAVTWNMAGINLADGYYTAKLPRTEAVSAQGLPLAATHSLLFHVLAGDSSGNAAVDFADFGDLANNFNTIDGPLSGPGDLNGDGDVDFADFGILANNFNRVLTAPAMDFGDAPQTGTAFPTTLPAGARHILGSGLLLGANVDAEPNGQPDAAAAGDGADEDGVAFAALQAGTTAAITVTAAVPATAVLNAWIDFNADGDWDDAGEQIFVDQALSNGANILTAAIPAGATAGSAFARFRITSCAGHSYFGLAPDGEVEDYQVTLVAAAARSAPQTVVAGRIDLWAILFVDHQSSQPKPQARLASSGAPLTTSDVVDLAVLQMVQSQQRPPKVVEGPISLEVHLVDPVFEEGLDPLIGKESSDTNRNTVWD